VPTDGAPAASLTRAHAVALVVGIVVGAGIFRAPPVVAAHTGSASAALLAWALGGLVTLAGALCYSELASTYPGTGGEYEFVRRAYGDGLAFLFGWARLTVIPTGSLAYVAFAFGDYASRMLPLGPSSSTIYAAGAVVAVIALNVAGVRQGAWTQLVLTALVVVGLALVIMAGLAGPAATPGLAAPAVAAEPRRLGLAMVFVLLTYGGWNEAAYISAEVRGGRRAIVGALVTSIGIVTVLYLLTNLALLRGLGPDALARSSTPAADLLEQSLGASGSFLISTLVAFAALTTANATLLMGSRTSHAFGRDWPLFSGLGRWSTRAASPVNAIVTQGAIALVLVAFGWTTRDGFEALVAYTAPVFWLFFLLTGGSLLVLRARDREAARPFRVPWYPLTPIVFCAACGWLLYSSIAYAGTGALLGVAVLAAGLVPLALVWRSRPTREEPA
jgi:amino acid transporter